jgi:hypothetical protein
MMKVKQVEDGSTDIDTQVIPYQWCTMEGL